LWHQWDDKDKP
jgi:hypothetical protein